MKIVLQKRFKSSFTTEIASSLATLQMHRTSLFSYGSPFIGGERNLNNEKALETQLT
jgi:hypothetical protein